MGIQHFGGSVKKVLVDGSTVLSSYVDTDAGERLYDESGPVASVEFADAISEAPGGDSEIAEAVPEDQDPEPVVEA